MARRVEIISKAEIFRQFIFRIDEVHLRHERYNGQMTPELTRLNLNRGDSVAAVLHDPDADTVLFTEQFRYPTYDKGPGWLLEIPAGTVEPGEAPEDTMRRELVEETGYTLEAMQHISTFYVSPGGTSERIWLYYAQVSPKQQTGAGGGVEHEGEDIRILLLKTGGHWRK